MEGSKKEGREERRSEGRGRKSYNLGERLWKQHSFGVIWQTQLTFLMPPLILTLHLISFYLPKSEML